MDLPSLHQSIDATFDTHLAAVQTFLRQVSIGATGEGMVDTAALCRTAIERLGGTVELASFGRYPIVYGQLHVGAPRTLLVWSKYDVMPADEAGWVAPPFSATICDWQDLGPCVVGRGAVDTKGPLQAFFNVLTLLVEANALPCNLLFVIEGEGEAGSDGMLPFVTHYRDELRSADAVLIPFCTQERDGSAAPNLGVKGLIQLEVSIEAGDWGGPAEHDVHGGNAAWLANPAWRLVHALATLVTPDERIVVPGYADGAAPPSAEDEALLTALNGRFNLEDQLRENGARRFKYQGNAADVVRHLLFEPTCNISGMFGGYTGPGFKTLVPQRAVARMDLRLVPGMEPERVLASLRRHLDLQGFPEIKLEATHQYPASKVPLSDPYVQAAVEMYRAHGVDTTVMPMKSGCAPLYLFTDLLERPWVMAGLGHGGGQHSSNEYVTVRGLADFEKSMVTLLAGMARVA